MVIVAGWRPGVAALACVGVAIAEAINIQLQVTGSSIPSELAPLLPYVLTFVMPLLYMNRKRQPLSLGKL
jgi:ABC-type uncharacterized transport system permease subunit